MKDLFQFLFSLIHGGQRDHGLHFNARNNIGKTDNEIPRAPWTRTLRPRLHGPMQPSQALIRQKIEEIIRDEECPDLSGELQIEALAAKHAAIKSAGDSIRSLAKGRDERLRFRFREEIRRRVKRIDVFPNGTYAYGASPVCATDQPGFKILFVNGEVRWVFCPNRKPPLPHG